jgi:site-specific DNA-methyltransferase (cytosine-N4-specific)
MTLLTWPDFKLLEYEHELARREVNAVLDRSFDETAEGLLIPGPFPEHGLRALTYFADVVSDSQRVATEQFQVESRHRLMTKRKSLKQSTRFLVHDFHEYKGKFNPQMARALINIYGASANLVIDPFCGSGTTLVEALRLDKNAIGFDLNPLATFISRTKVAVTLHPSPQELLRDFQAFSKSCIAKSQLRRRPSSACLEQLWGTSLEYLIRWFPPESLWPLFHMLESLKGDSGLPSDLLRMAISNVVREISWQLPEDLRVRRRSADWEPPSIAPLIQRSLHRIESALLEQLAISPSIKPLEYDVVFADAREISTKAELTSSPGTVIVTSPPYATALPYVDTDRLSIVVLGLADSNEIKGLDAKLIGSREWDRAEAEYWEDCSRSNSHDLSTEITELIASIQKRNQADEAGFRRIAVPGLLYRYFTHMKKSLSSWSTFLAQGEHAVLVVGSNRTAGTTAPIHIQTPSLIASLAPQSGFDVTELLELQTWPRYGMHSKNGVSTESAVVLTRNAEVLDT